MCRIDKRRKIVESKINRLTELQSAQIFALKQSGMSYSKIAEQLGISKKTVG
jgi:DNA-directed RNA polymerase specialized sigma24 family protein